MRIRELIETRAPLAGGARIGMRLLVVLLLVLLHAARPAFAETLRLAVQKTGTFAWELDIVASHGLAEKAGVALEVTELASPEAARIALVGGSADMILTDWLWVSRERTLGRRLVFRPYSSTVGAVLVPAASPIRDLAGLERKRLAIAGGPLDKSWLLLRAFASRAGFDIAKRAQVLYGAPALLYQKTLAGAADATLTFWTYSVALEARGFRRLVDIAEVERRLGTKGPVAMIGYVFDESLAEKRPGLVDRFFAITAEAKRILAGSEALWDRIAPKIGKVDETAQLALYRRTYLDGIPRRPIEEEEADARMLYAVLAEAGGPDLVGPGRELDPGTYYKGIGPAAP
jgi:NitT/TauT family transport system substrate-binding protein